MTLLDPIIAVKDVEASAEWYQRAFGFKRAHGESDSFAVLVSGYDIILCLHAWEAHNHPSMKDPESSVGNGLILYFRTEDLKGIRTRFERLGAPVEEEIHINPNSSKKEFSARDPDGYYLTISEFHTY